MRKTFAIFVLIAAMCAMLHAQDEAVALFNKAQDVHEKGDLNAAVDLYTKAIESYPEFPEAEYQRATAYLSLGKRVDAEKGFRRALELREDWTLAQASLGSLLVSASKFAEAETLLNRALETEPQNSSALIALADLKVRTKAQTSVLQDLNERIAGLAAKANRSSSLWTSKAALEIALKRPADARVSLAEALRLDPANRIALFQSAELALIEGDLERARADARLIEEKGYKGDELTYLKAELLASEGKTDDALKLLDSITQQNDALADLRKRIAASAATSTADLEKQLAADPRSAPVLGRLCTLYRRDDPAKALDYCKRANEIEPNNAEHAIGFAAALVQAKQYAQAVDLLRRIMKIVPDNRTARANLGAALFQSGRYAEAKPEFEWLIAKQPNAPGAYFFLGLAHDHLGEFVDAAANYQAFLRLADATENKFDIERVKLRMPALEKELKKVKKND